MERPELARVDDNAFRLDIEEAARLAGLQFKVDAVLNNRREVVGLFAGDFVAEHRSGVELAREVYATKMLKDMDILVINGYPDECQVEAIHLDRADLLAAGGRRSDRQPLPFGAGRASVERSLWDGLRRGWLDTLAAWLCTRPKLPRVIFMGRLFDEVGQDGAGSTREGGVVQDLGRGAGRLSVATRVRHQGRCLPLPADPGTCLKVSCFTSSTKRAA